MQKVFLSILLLVSILSSINAKYLDSKSCNECHENIHYEHTLSMHHNSSLFKDNFHRKIKETTTPDEYSCALCHTPNATNLRALMTGEEQPDPRDKRQTDGVSCFYCHQITKVLETKHRNINFYAYKENTKPSFFGNLSSPGDSDKHGSDYNDIYQNSKVCMGCHGKKYNKQKVEICNGYNQIDETSDCISCHMPKVPGDITKLNKKGRMEYASHEFQGIRSDDMVKKAVKLSLKLDNNILKLTIKNMMGHSIIMQPMRLKYVQTKLIRDGKTIWQNYDKSPLEDKKATFTTIFKGKNDEQVFPPFATGYIFNNNLKANSSVTISYDLPKLQSEDTIKSTWISYVVRPEMVKSLNITDEKNTKKYIGYSVELIK